jgi:hypothetical protein
MTGTSDLKAAESVARADLAESAAALQAAEMSGDPGAIETAAATVGRCLSELSARQADVVDAGWTRAVEAHAAEPEAGS